MKTLYQTQATAIGGRVGSAASADGRLRVRLDLPGALGGDNREGTNPEQLFAAGYAAAFLSAIRRMADREGLTLAPDSNVTATISLAGDAVDEDCRLSVSLTVDLPGLGDGDARRIVSAAHAACPYASATRGNLGIRITID
jgi:osmotically inducible protein OsmC